MRDYVNEPLDKTDGITIDMTDTHVVWHCKTLQNWKALVSTTLPDGMYYEVTYNGKTWCCTVYKPKAGSSKWTEVVS